MIKAVVIAFIILMLLPAKGNKAKDKQQHRPWYYIRYDDTRRLCYKMEIRLDHRKRDSAWFRFEGANTENRPLCVPGEKNSAPSNLFPFFGESVADRLPLRQGFGTIKEQR